MKFSVEQLSVVGTHGPRTIRFAEDVTFIHGAMGAGKSTIARLIDYCLGGELERTPALRESFVVAKTHIRLEHVHLILERGATEASSVRATWENDNGDVGSANVPIRSGSAEILPGVFNLSDLMYSLCGETPLRIRRSKQDPDSPLIRLGFRELFRFCYLPQDTLDSSFYKLDDTLTGRSRDAMRFIVGLFSDRLNELEADLQRSLDDQRASRIAVEQVRRFLRGYGVGSSIDIAAETLRQEGRLTAARSRLATIEADYRTATHFADDLRRELRDVSESLSKEEEAVGDLRIRIDQQTGLRSELINARVKATRAVTSGAVLSSAQFASCPACGLGVEPDRSAPDTCYLCLQGKEELITPDLEALSRDLDSRIDELSESVARHLAELDRAEESVVGIRTKKEELDSKLSSELQAYDSAFLSNARSIERKIARFRERLRSLAQAATMSADLDEIEASGVAAKERADDLRQSIKVEQQRLQGASRAVAEIQDELLATLLAIHYPGVDADDKIGINTKTWMPEVFHPSHEQAWTFKDIGSGGKKVMFKVSFALALHKAATKLGLPLPAFLMIDSPLKNISPDVNPELVRAFYANLYESLDQTMPETQVVIIDSDLVRPELDELSFVEILMDPSDEANPPLIPGYEGP